MSIELHIILFRNVSIYFCDKKRREYISVELNIRMDGNTCQTVFSRDSFSMDVPFVDLFFLVFLSFHLQVCFPLKKVQSEYFRLFIHFLWNFHLTSFEEGGMIVYRDFQGLLRERSKQ